MPRLRPTSLLLLLALLGGCSVYENIVHPYRLPTPEPPPEFKRQQKAKMLANKNRDKAARIKKPKSADPDAAPAADAPPPPDAAAATADGGKRQPATNKSTVKYDKAGLMKKPKLLRRRRYKPPGRGFHPLRGLKNMFRSKHHGKPKPKTPSGADAPADAAPDAPADAAPTDAPAR